MATKSLIQGKDSAGPSGWVNIDPSKKRTIQVVISGVASVDIEGSNDGFNPVTLQAGVSASGGFVDDEPWHQLRANVKSITSGTVSVIVGEQ